MNFYNVMYFESMLSTPALSSSVSDFKLSIQPLTLILAHLLNGNEFAKSAKISTLKTEKNLKTLKLLYPPIIVTLREGTHVQQRTTQQ